MRPFAISSFHRPLCLFLQPSQYCHCAVHLLRDGLFLPFCRLSLVPQQQPLQRLLVNVVVRQAIWHLLLVHKVVWKFGVLVRDGRLYLRFREESRPSEVRPSEVRPEEDRPAEVCLKEVHPAEVRLKEVRPEEERPAEVRPTKVRPDEVRLEEERPAEVRPAEVRPIEEHPEEERPEEVRPEEVRSYIPILLPPLIPDLHALLKNLNMLFIRHISLLFAPSPSISPV